MSKKLIDISISVMLILFFLIPMLFIVLAIKLTSKGPAIYWSERVGRGNEIFRMPKFRSMKIDTKAVATDLLENPSDYLTPIGGFLRRTSLDELPQLFTILKGDMSLVGPRPALFNQKELVRLRTEVGIESILPGITGWAQVNGRDELSIQKKVKLDFEYLNNQSHWLDLKILWLTLIRVLKKDNVSH